jgi:hypothetical protein
MWEEDLSRSALLLAPGESATGVAATDLTVTAATPTSATATGAGAGGTFFSFAVGVAFNIRFGGSTVANPADTASFPAGMYSVYLNGAQTHFKITANATGKATYWKSSR